MVCRREAAKRWILGLAVAALLIPGLASAQPTAAGFTQRVREALEKTRNVSVVYQDVLGEGPGSWDPDPRYPEGKVNCLTWLHLLLAEAYGSNPEEKLAVMDRLRYFDGHPAFGLRKHFIDQWAALDPLPLRRVDFSFCRSSAVQPFHLDLSPGTFTKSISYGCPLYHQDKTAVDLEVIPPHGLVQCGGMLPEGYYVLFPVATERYLQKYGTFSGPMAQVHSVLLEVAAVSGGVGGVGVPPESRDAAQYKVFHASISSGKVVETELASYVLHMWNLYRGYVVYELVPDWDWKSQPPLDEEARAVLACEKRLEGKVGKLFENEVQTRQP